MTYILLMLLLTVIKVQHVSSFPSCPASCAVCSEDAIICQRLAHIIDAPDSTQALLLTDGSISTVQPAALSDLSNITVIGLSHNHISELNREAFRSLLFLHTLLLDHNLLTSQALQGGALTNLTQLEVLSLGHNLISMTEAGWFIGTKALRSLKLEGNLLTSLDSGSFPLNDLMDLETLDLSDNLIDRLDRNSFRGLVSLKTLDLSRNRLSSAPAEAFSYLNWLTNLNLDLNSWNCSCQLLELAAFLSTFIQNPDKTPYNGRRMVCVSADNPAVTTVLELTEANCVPSNQNITVQIETRDSVTPQLYARDVAITGVICFMGGIFLTLLAVLICYKVHQKKKLKENRRLKEEAEASGIAANHQPNHVNGSQQRRDIFFQDDGKQPWNKEGLTIDARTDGYGILQLRSRAEDNSGYFRCANCSTDGPRSNAMKRMNGGVNAEETSERRRMKMMIEEERRRTGPQHGVFPSDTPNNFIAQTNMNSFFVPQKDVPPHKSGRDIDSQRPEVDVRNRGYESVHCENCHRAYRPPDHNMRPARFHGGPRDAAHFDGFHPQHRLNDRARNDKRHFDTVKNTDLRRETRNVTFDLEGLRIKEKASGREEERYRREASTHRNKDKAKEKRHKVQSSGLLKTKLNLNPLRKSKVHPKKKGELGNTEKSSPKKSREKGRAVKETEEKERKGKKSKHGSDKAKESERSTEDGVEENKEGQGDKGEQKSKALSKKKNVSKGEQGDQESTEGNNTDNIQPENSQPADSAASAVVSAQGQTSQDLQHQAAGVALSGAQLSSQHPFSLLSADRSRTTNMPLLGYSGSSLSLQGGNFQLSTMTSAPSMLLPSTTAHSVTPGLAVSGPNVAPSGIPDSLSRQAALGSTSFPSLLSGSLYANPLQAAVAQATPPQASQTVGPPMNLAANTVVNTQSIQSNSLSQFPHDSSPAVAKQKPDPGQGSSALTGEGAHRLSGESKPPNDSRVDQSEENTSEVTPLNLEPAATVENISNNNSQTETGNIPGVSTVNVSAEAPAVVGSRDGLQAAGASAPDIPSQSGSSAGAALLQQEYLSEEGGSSPRRKLRLVLPEKTSGRTPTALERKIR